MGKQIAVLGLGAMGSRMAARLIDAGHDVVLYNRTSERVTPLVDRGARAAESPRAAADGCDIVISIVRDDGASREVWLEPSTGALSGMHDGAVAVESSTLTPAWIDMLAREMSRRSVEFVDAPVAGSRPQAEAGQLVYLVGGGIEVVEALQEVLLSMGGAVHHVGPTGAGAVMKLAVNALLGIQAAALGEILGMTRHAGISDANAVELLGAMPVTSPALKGVGGLMAARKFDPMFPIELVEKDLGYVVDAGDRLDNSMPTSSAVREVFRRAIEAGFGGDNIVGVMKLFE